MADIKPLVENIAPGSQDTVTVKELNAIRGRVKRIRDDWHQRLLGNILDVSAPSFLKGATYQLACEIALRWGCKSGFRRLQPCLDTLGGVKRSSRPAEPNEEDLIALVLRAIVTVDGIDHNGWLLQLKHSERNHYAVELAYAMRHCVSPELLIGFIHQVGGWRAIVRSDRGHEAWFNAETHTWKGFRNLALSALSKPRKQVIPKKPGRISVSTEW